MKKILTLFTLLFTLLIFSQEQEKDSLPKFDNPKLTAYVKAYDKYMKKYKAIVQTKDMGKMAELAKQAEELAVLGQQAVDKKLTEDDTKKLTDYMTKKVKEAQELAQKLADQ